MVTKSIILATNQGLDKILGQTLISYSVEALQGIGVRDIGILAGSKSIDIKDILDLNVASVFQEKLDMTQVISFIGQDRDIIILNGNTPLLRASDLKHALEVHGKSDKGITILSSHLKDQADYGEIYIFKAKELKEALVEEKSFKNVIKALQKDKATIESIIITNETHLLKVDTRSQLAKCTRIMKEAINEKHMENGVTIEDPWNTYIGPKVTIGYDTIIEPGCILRGNTSIGKDCLIGCNTNIENSHISNGVRIENSVIYESFVDDHTHIGPFAYIRPDSKIGKNVRIGDFVEIKNASIGDYTKISHLTYVGDADVGEHVNFGCGSVLVNYDGVDKHRSTIEDHAFIGCNTNLISPVTVGERAYTAAGSTITKDVPDESLGIGRAKQVNKEGWVAYKHPKK